MILCKHTQNWTEKCQSILPFLTSVITLHWDDVVIPRSRIFKTNLIRKIVSFTIFFLNTNYTVGVS